MDSAKDSRLVRSRGGVDSRLSGVHLSLLRDSRFINGPPLNSPFRGRLRPII